MSETYSRKWKHAGGIIRRRGEKYQVEISYNGNRHRHSEDSLEAAKSYIDQKQIEIGNKGTATFDLSNKQRVDAVEAMQIISGKMAIDKARTLSTPLCKAATYWVEHKHTGSTITVQTLFEQYLSEKEAAGRSVATMKELRNRLGLFVKSFGSQEPQTITRNEIKNWLKNDISTSANRKKCRNLLFTFFKYAEAEDLIPANPVRDLSIGFDNSKPTEIEIYTADETERLLNAASKVAPETVHNIAIGLFSGLRPSETLALQWEDINIAHKRITVRSETAKKRRKRTVKMSDNLIAWLTLHRKKEGRVSPSDATLRKKRPAILEEAKIEKWIHDGLRHTYGSMHVEKYGDPQKTAHEMGHREMKTMYNHYATGIDNPDDADNYWNIYPKGKTKVISFEASA